MMEPKSLSELLETQRDFSARDLNLALNIVNDYTAVVPFLQFPVPDSRGVAHAVALRFPSTLDPATVTSDTVLMVVRGEAAPVQAEVRLVDESTVLIQPNTPLRQGRSDDDLVHIIVSPRVAMQDGRSFAGISYVVSAG
jgi:hypothetical protein